MKHREQSRKKPAVELIHALAWVICLMQVSPVFAAADFPTPKRVLALYWYGKDFPINVDLDRGLQTAFRDGGIEYHAEYFEPNQFPGEGQVTALRDYLRRKYSDRKVNVVIAMSFVSADFILKYRDDLFPNVPIVFHTANRTQLSQRVAGTNFPGVVPDNNQARTLDVALRLHPATEHVFVINGTIEKDKAVEAILKEQLRGFESKVAISYLTDLPLNELLARVKSLPKRSLIFYSRQDYEEPGMSLSFADVLVLIAGAAKVPIYGFGLYVGYGAVGGYAVNTYECGIQAGRMALGILNGSQPNEPPVVEVPSIAMFDWNQLRRWGIDEDKLPAGSEIRFKELTVFEQYKWRIIGALTLCVVQSFLIAGLLTERRRRRLAQAKLMEDITQRKLAEQELQLLSTRLLDSQDQERRRVARELHDGTAQNLCAIKLNLENLESTMALPVNFQHTFLDCRTLCQQSLEEIRTLSYLLHPPMLDEAGLLASLHWYLDGFTRRSGIDVEFIATQDIGRLPEKVEMDLFRIVQECLANIHRHSGSRTAQVCMELQATQVVLRVQDQGRGMPSPHSGGNPVGSRPAGVGLSGMAQRLRYLGGHLEIESNSYGTMITAVVPLPREAHGLHERDVAAS